MNGLDLRINRLDDLAREIEANAQRLNDESAKRLVATAEQYVPVRTGDLFLSIRDEPDADSPYPQSLVIAGSNAEGIDYPVFVEYGTQNMAAQPFMTPAADQESRRLVEEVRDGIL